MPEVAATVDWTTVSAAEDGVSSSATISGLPSGANFAMVVHICGYHSSDSAMDFSADWNGQAFTWPAAATDLQLGANMFTSMGYLLAPNDVTDTIDVTNNNMTGALANGPSICAVILRNVNAFLDSDASATVASLTLAAGSADDMTVCGGGVYGTAEPGIGGGQIAQITATAQSNARTRISTEVGSGVTVSGSGSYFSLSAMSFSNQAPPAGSVINQFQGANLGADLYNGVLS